MRTIFHRSVVAGVLVLLVTLLCITAGGFAADQNQITKQSTVTGNHVPDLGCRADTVFTGGHHPGEHGDPNDPDKTEPEVFIIWLWDWFISVGR